MVKGIDYREEAALEAFPNIKNLGASVHHKERCSDWVVNAEDLEKLLVKTQKKTRFSVTVDRVIYTLYVVVFIACYFYLTQ